MTSLPRRVDQRPRARPWVTITSEVYLCKPFGASYPMQGSCIKFRFTGRHIFENAITLRTWKGTISSAASTFYVVAGLQRYHRVSYEFWRIPQINHLSTMIPISKTYMCSRYNVLSCSCISTHVTDLFCMQTSAWCFCVILVFSDRVKWVQCTYLISMIHLPTSSWHAWYKSPVQIFANFFPNIIHATQLVSSFEEHKVWYKLVVPQ